MEERKRTEHKIVLTDRSKLSVTGVEDVDSFDDDKIIAYTVEGVMTVKGAELRINRLSLEDGGLEIEGDIDSIEYSDGHKSDGGGFFSKIFK